MTCIFLSVGISKRSEHGVEVYSTANWVRRQIRHAVAIARGRPGPCWSPTRPLSVHRVTSASRRRTTSLHSSCCCSNCSRTTSLHSSCCCSNCSRTTGLHSNCRCSNCWQTTNPPPTDYRSSSHQTSWKRSPPGMPWKRCCTGDRRYPPLRLARRRRGRGDASPGRHRANLYRRTRLVTGRCTPTVTLRAGHLPDRVRPSPGLRLALLARAGTRP